MGLLSWIKEKIKMLFKTDAEKAFGVETYLSPEMEAAVKLWKSTERYYETSEFLGKLESLSFNAEEKCNYYDEKKGGIREVIEFIRFAGEKRKKSRCS